jgi:hypothetical protein
LILFVPLFSGTTAGVFQFLCGGLVRQKNLRPNDKALLPLAYSKEDATAAWSGARMEGRGVYA